MRELSYLLYISQFLNLLFKLKQNVKNSLGKQYCVLLSCLHYASLKYCEMDIEYNYNIISDIATLNNTLC